MENWLVAHALRNVWCQPSLDRRWIVGPARISRPGGEQFGMQVMGHSIRMPKDAGRFNVFQIGGLRHNECGIGRLWNGWSRLDKIITEFSVLLTLYNEVGRSYPLALTWIRRLPNGTILLALERDDNQVDFGKESLYLRIYNGYFGYTAEYAERYKTHAQSTIVRNTAERTAVLLEFQRLVAGTGAPTAYVNGVEVDNLDIASIALWDHVDIVHDGLVKYIDYFRVKDLKGYTSEVDNTRKYIIHPPKRTSSIEFINDIDVFIIGNNNRGRYYNQHKSESLRQLTHQDYGLHAGRVAGYIGIDPAWNSIDSLTVKLITRRSGMERPLQYESSRIHELYKCTDAQIINVMSGVDSLLPEWTAAKLETSAYCRLMASSLANVNNDMVSKAYGYNAVAKYAADTPQKTYFDGGLWRAQIPEFLAANCTVYEYDEDGVLSGFYNSNSTTDGDYLCRHDTTRLIEVIEGYGTKELSINHNAIGAKLVRGINYRFYTNKLVSGAPSDEFEEVTGTDAYSVDVHGNVTWNVDLTRRRPVIWSDARFTAYSFTANAFTGVLKFTVDHWFADGSYKPFPFQYASLDVWMNGKSLVNGVDYYVQWPQVVICNKEYLPNDPSRHSPLITVRCRGFGDELRKPETGFVVNGLISNNRNFDIRDDKVVRITVGGKTVDRKDYKFREDTAIMVDSSLNGLPYTIDDAVIPVRDLMLSDTYQEVAKARDLDVRVSDFMTQLLPTPVNIAHNPIAALHHVYSPILNQVIHDMISLRLVPVQDNETYYISTEQFDRIMEPYLYLLHYDPVINNHSTEYVIVHPHDGNDLISLTPLQYSVVEKITRRYLRNKVTLNNHLIVED